MTLFDAASVADDALTLMRQTLSAFALTMECMSREASQRGEINPAQAIFFAKRFPLYTDAFDVILRDMQRTVDALQDGVDAIYAADMARQGKEKPNA